METAPMRTTLGSYQRSHALVADTVIKTGRWVDVLRIADVDLNTKVGDFTIIVHLFAIDCAMGITSVR